MSTSTKTPVLLLISTLSLVFSLLATPLIAAAMGEVAVSVNILNVRSGPGLDYDTISKISQSEKYTVLEEKNNWYKIRLSSTKEGWVASWLVQFKAAQGTIKVVESKVNRLNVRSGPDTSFQVSRQIRPEQTFALLKTEGDWSQIQINAEETGWVANWLIEIKEGEPNHTEPSSQSTGTNSSVGENPTPNSQQSKREVKVTTNTLNMRSNGSLEAPVVEKLSRDTILEVISEQGDWFEIRYKDKKGWIANWLVEDIHKQASNQPKVSILNEGTNLREGPGTNFAVVSRANQGDTFDVLETEGDWFQIALESGKTAYIAGWIVFAEGTANVERQGIQSYLQGKKIVIDPGHGGNDNGATGSHFNTLEKVVNLQLSQLLQSKLEAAGANVVITRNSDRFISLQQRVNVSINENADAFLSIHHNTNPNTKINGTITYFYSQEDRKLASFIQKNVVKNNGLNNLNARQGNFFVLRENPRPSILLEIGFLTNYNDELTIRTNKFQENSVNGILYGVANYFKDKEE